MQLNQLPNPLDYDSVLAKEDNSLLYASVQSYDYSTVGAEARLGTLTANRVGTLVYESYWYNLITSLLARENTLSVNDAGYYSKIEIENRSNLNYANYRHLSREKQDVYEAQFEILGKVIEDMNVDEDVYLLHTVEDVLTATDELDLDSFDREFFLKVYAPNYNKMRLAYLQSHPPAEGQSESYELPVPYTYYC